MISKCTVLFVTVLALPLLLPHISTALTEKVCLIQKTGDQRVVRSDCTKRVGKLDVYPTYDCSFKQRGEKKVILGGDIGDWDEKKPVFSLCQKYCLIDLVNSRKYSICTPAADAKHQHAIRGQNRIYFCEQYLKKEWLRFEVSASDWLVLPSDDKRCRKKTREGDTRILKGNINGSLRGGQ